LEGHSNQAQSRKIFQTMSYYNLILPVFTLESHPKIVTQMPPIFQVGVRGYLFFTIKRL
jgi:hypothetical protein